MMNIFVQGLLLQASLILALGAQNIFVLNSGLRRERHLLVATICAVCDTVLVLVGVLGAASIFLEVPSLKTVFGILGVTFLCYYGILKIKEAITGASAQNDVTPLPLALRRVILTTLSFSLLNPHVYLDTVVLVGGYSAKFTALTDRLAFGLGAAATSWVWFLGLATLASAGNRLLHNPRAMRMISALSGLILISLSIKLGLDVWTWGKTG